MKTISVDFDGVIHSYTSGWKGAHVVSDPPVEGALNFLVVATLHFKVVIFSARNTQSGGVEAMKSYLLRHLSYEFGTKAAHRVVDALSFPEKKPSTATIHIDDRAFVFEGKFPSVQWIKEFKPWNRR